MANKHGRCVVCGKGPTVKSHLFPRALMLDIRDGGGPLIEGSRHREGYVERQNGVWDDRFLCKLHEDLAGAGDDYAVRLSRRLETEAVAHPDGIATRISNPKPELLLRFAYGVIWRHVMAPVSAPSALDLGRYRLLIERALFEDGPLDLPVLLAVPNLVGSDGRPIAMAVGPHRVRFHGRWAWHFIVNKMEFFIKTDQQPWPSDWQQVMATEDPLTLFQAEPQNLASTPMFSELVARIRTAGYSRRNL